ncbi:MAG: hypothetical protein AB7V27_19730 [Candidatus Binatia bacterium]
MTSARSIAVLGLALALICAPPAVHAGDTPHHMTKSDGSLDVEACAVCHNEDMSLQRSELETCTLCHSRTLHAGADEHLRASAPAVKRSLAGRAEGAPALPLTRDGQMYCGTCHLFHDPQVDSQQWLEHGWLPPEGGLPGAVRQGVIERWAALAARSDEQGTLGSFAAKAARQMRLPVDKGQLCGQCHAFQR